jgi:hypothetical protein
MQTAMTAQLVTDALVMAIWRRGKPDALLHHSDRGSQIHQRAVPTADDGSRRRLLDEPLGQRVGQCGDGELLLRRHSTIGYMSPCKKAPDWGLCRFNFWKSGFLIELKRRRIRRCDQSAYMLELTIVLYPHSRRKRVL